MTKFIGRLVDLGIGRETSRGAGVAPSYWLPKVGFTFDDKQIKARSIAGVGKISDSEEAFVTTKYGEGDVEGEVRVQSFGLLLYALLGDCSTSGPSDSAYTHSFTIDQSNQHQSLAFVVKDPNATEIYKLVMLNSLEMAVELDSVVSFTANFMSKKGNAYTPPSVSYSNEYKFTKKHLQLKVASNIAGLSGASALSVKSLRLSFSKNVVLDDSLGTAEPEDILNQQLSVEGELTLNYEDETWKNYAKDGTNRAMEVFFNNTDATIGGGSTNPSLKFQFPKVDFYDWTPNYALDEIVTQTVSFKANRDVENDQDIVYLCELVNGVTSY